MENTANEKKELIDVLVKTASFLDGDDDEFLYRDYLEKQDCNELKHMISQRTNKE